MSITTTATKTTFAWISPPGETIRAGRTLKSRDSACVEQFSFRSNAEQPGVNKQQETWAPKRAFRAGDHFVCCWNGLTLPCGREARISCTAKQLKWRHKTFSRGENKSQCLPLPAIDNSTFGNVVKWRWARLIFDILKLKLSAAVPLWFSLRKLVWSSEPVVTTWQCARHGLTEATNLITLALWLVNRSAERRSANLKAGTKPKAWQSIQRAWRDYKKWLGNFAIFSKVEVVVLLGLFWARLEGAHLRMRLASTVFST